MPAPDAVNTIPLDRLIPDPVLPRRILLPASTAQLASDLGTHGQLEPLHARPPIDGTAHLRVIHGRRRLAAMKAGGITSARVIVEDNLDDRTVLCRHIARNQADPPSPLETAWMTARMVAAERTAGTKAPQRVVAEWLHAHVGTGSQATVARRMKIARVLTPDWVDEVDIPVEALMRLPEARLIDAAKIPDDDQRSEELRVAAGLLPPPEPPERPPFEVSERIGGGWVLALTEMPSDEWSDEDLAVLIETIEPVVDRARSLREEEPPAVIEARARAAVDWSNHLATVIEALETAQRERDAALRTLARHRTRDAARIMTRVGVAARWLRRRFSTRTFTMEVPSSSLKDGRHRAGEVSPRSASEPPRP